MKNIDLIPLTKDKTRFDLPGSIDIRNIRITTTNLFDLRILELTIKFYKNNKMIFSRLIQPNDKLYQISEMSFSPSIIASTLIIESKKNIDYTISGLINF
jgi:hypothetical protein